MRVRVLSDLHLEFAELELEWAGEDVLVLAGDLSPDLRQALALLRRYREGAGETRVVMCLGNHDYYGDRSMDQVERVWQGNARNFGIDLLVDSSVVIGGFRFYGATMWTDMAGRSWELETITDFSAIPGASVERFRRIHDQSRARLALCLGESAEPVVVVTHHLPTAASVDPRYRGDATQGAYCSTDMDDLVGRAALWIHGHTHASIDVVVDGTRVVCNPRGYCDRAPENPRFDPHFGVEL